MELRVKLLSEDAVAPFRTTRGSAAYDLSVPKLPEGKVFIVPVGEKFKIPLDFAVAIPHGYCGIISARSSFSYQWKVDIMHGVIDSDYRGNVSLVLYNHGEKEFIIFGGSRIAQMVIQPIHTPDVVLVETLDQTERGVGGFGSTGK